MYLVRYAMINARCELRFKLSNIFARHGVDDEIDLMDLSIDKNMIDKDEYPQTAEMKTAAYICYGLMEFTDAENTLGCSTIGSSEAAMLMD